MRRSALAPTMPPREVSRRKIVHLDLASYKGRRIKFVTESGATYWLLVLKDATVYESYIRGVMIHTDSQRFGHCRVDPSDFLFGRFINVGAICTYGSNGRTTVVTKIADTW